VAEVRIAAEPRTEFGKGGARRTRRAGKVPAVLYGHGQPPSHVSFVAHDFEQVLRTDAGTNVLLQISVDGQTKTALPKAIDRDPVKRTLEHVDLITIRRGQKVEVDVGVHVTGEAAPDTLVDQQLTVLTVEADATAIPEGFEVSIEGMDVGDGVHAADVTLPDAVELRTDPEALVVHVIAAPTAAEVEAELAEAEEDVGIERPGAEGAEVSEEAREAAAAEAPAAEGGGDEGSSPSASQ
jgi:large subunit ribosomal protein L25